MFKFVHSKAWFLIRDQANSLPIRRQMQVFTPSTTFVSGHEWSQKVSHSLESFIQPGHYFYLFLND